MKISAILLIPLFIFFSFVAAIAVANEQTPVIEPPELPNVVESGEEIEPQITIIRQGDEVIEEYRINNNLYMVKITPAVGLPYYLIDYDGDGRIDFRKNDLDDVIVPQWVLFTW